VYDRCRVIDIEIGSVVADTYTIEAELGRGGMGTVFLASHSRLPGKRVALKVLRADVANAEMVARFKREAQIVSQLAHPNIVHVEDFNVTPDGTPYLVLEYLQGESLAQRLLRGRTALEPALAIARQIGAALAAAHARGIVHRDLKPQNIFLVADQVKVLDFGISKVVDSQTVKTEDNALLGTPQYMSPEQASGKHEQIDVRTDVFALAAIVHEMLAGAPAFSGGSIPEIVYKVVYESPRPLPADVPAQVAAAIEQAMAKAPENRFATVGGFVEALTGKRISVPVVGDAAFAKTVGSGDAGPSPLAGSTLPEGKVDLSAPVARAGRWRGLALVLACAGAAAIATVIAFIVMGRGKHDERVLLDTPTMRTVAAQLFDGSDVELDGRHYTVGEKQTLHLRYVKFSIFDHPFEAIEQNPEKPSAWGKLARAGHKVVEFKDSATNRYIGVTVDGERVGGVPEAP
jgi:hypothetical protein